MVVSLEGENVILVRVSEVGIIEILIKILFLIIIRIWSDGGNCQSFFDWLKIICGFILEWIFVKVEYFGV